MVTLGPKGSVAFTETHPEGIHVDAYPVRATPVYCNGAGDNFEAGFFYAYLKGLPLETCLKVGNFCASNILKRIGAQSEVKIRGIEFIV